MRVSRQGLGTPPDADYDRLNALTLRNATFANVMDGCAISIPITPQGAAPVGLT